MHIPYSQNPSLDQTSKQPALQNSHNASLNDYNRGANIEELDEAIGRLNHKINSANYELMLLIREFDERVGWLKWGFTDALHWLMWRCDLSTGAARDKLRIAHALKTLPQISNAFSKGKLSYTKVRSLTRIATADNETELIEMALKLTARQVEAHCKQRSNASIASTKHALKADHYSSYRLWPDHAHGTVHLSIELPEEEAQLIEKAIEKAAVQLSSETSSSNPAELDVATEDKYSWARLQAKALVAISRIYLDRSGSYNRNSECDSTSVENTSSSSADHYQVVVHVDESALAASDKNDESYSSPGTSQYPIETVRRLCCDGSIVPIIESDTGEPLSVGRKVRTITTSIRRALWARDKGCRFPGCTHTRFVDAHHIKHWAHGGETNVQNLVLLCSTHHKLVHEGGYSIHHDHAGELYFRRADGRAVPTSGYSLSDINDEHPENSREFFDSTPGVTKSEVSEPAYDYLVTKPLLNYRQFSVDNIHGNWIISFHSPLNSSPTRLVLNSACQVSGLSVDADSVRYSSSNSAFSAPLT